MQKLLEKIEILDRTYDQVRQLNKCYRLCALTTLRNNTKEFYDEIQELLRKHELSINDVSQFFLLILPATSRCIDIVFRGL